jgi:allantoinase
VMCIPLHAYLIGQPHRIGPFEEVLRHIAADGRAWITRSGDIADHFLASGAYDAAKADCALYAKEEKA